MLIKNYSKTGNFCRVTFKLPAELEAETAVICGEFNDWDKSSTPMKKLKDGSFSKTISLPARKKYRFRYLLDEKHWENDWQADAYATNIFGTDDSILQL